MVAAASNAESKCGKIGYWESETFIEAGQF